MNFLNRFTFYILILLTVYSCSTDCNCEQEWYYDDTYCEGELVLSAGKCYIAVTQNIGDLPMAGNESWEACTY